MEDQKNLKDQNGKKMLLFQQDILMGISFWLIFKYEKLCVHRHIIFIFVLDA